MTSPKPNITLADGSTRYLPPSGRLHLSQLIQAGDSGMDHPYEPVFSQLITLELVEGIKQRGTNKWHWHLTAHGYHVAQQLAGQA